MADQKKIDKASKKISTIYTKGITDIVKSIIDNRKGQEDFEVDEEGNGKWIIRNIKTSLN